MAKNFSLGAVLGGRAAGMRAFGAMLISAMCLAGANDAVARDADTQRQMNAGGGTNATNGLRWLIGSNSQFQVYMNGQGQVYNPSAEPTDSGFGSSAIYNSVWLRVDRSLVNATNNNAVRVYHNGDENRDLDRTYRLTQVSQTALTGNGTVASPWQVTTVLRPSQSVDQGITVTIVDRYIAPQAWLTRRVSLTGMPTSGASIKLYQIVDTYLQGGDNGPGYSVTSPGNTAGTPDIVGVTKGALIEATAWDSNSGLPLWDRYFSGFYEHSGRYACTGGTGSGGCSRFTGDLPNTIDNNPNTDNGMAVQWNVPQNATTFAAQYRIAFGSENADLDKSFLPTNIMQGQTSTLTFTLTNRTINVADPISFTDTFPAGIQIAAIPNIRTSCPNGGATLVATLPAGMAVVATPGGNSIAVTGASVTQAAAGSTRTCQILVDVTSQTVGTHVNGAGNISNVANIVNLVGDRPLVVTSAAADILITLDNGASQVTAGQMTTYNMLVRNVGPGGANNSVVKNDWVADGQNLDCSTASGGTLTCLTPSGGASCPATLTPEGLQAGLAIPLLPAGGELTLQLACRVLP